MIYFGFHPYFKDFDMRSNGYRFAAFSYCFPYWFFDLFGNNNNNINNKNDNNNNNPYNNIFLQISDGTNQQPNFDQNNLGFLNLGNNMNNNMPNNAGNMMMNNNQNNNIFNGQNNNNNNSQNQTNNAANIDLLNF